MDVRVGRWARLPTSLGKNILDCCGTKALLQATHLARQRATYDKTFRGGKLEYIEHTNKKSWMFVSGDGQATRCGLAKFHHTLTLSLRCGQA